MRVWQCFCHPAGCVSPFFLYHDGNSERPKQRASVDNAVNQQKSHNHSSKMFLRPTLHRAAGQQLQALICQQARSVELDPSVYLSITLHPLHLSLPLHLKRTLTLQRQIPSLYLFPQQQVIYHHLSSMLMQLGETRTTCKKK